MAKAPPAFQFYVGDFLTGTAHLDAEAIGCYLLLLCFQWAHGFVPSDASQRARICRMTPPDFGPMWGLLEDKFVVGDDGRLRNERMEVVRANQLAISEKRREAGRKGGKAFAKQMPKQKQSKGRLKVEDRRLKYSTKELDEKFAEWWELVPRKTQRGEARRKYEAACGRLFDRGVEDPAGFLADRMAAFKQSDKAKGDYCPYPSTWLHQERYDDDPATWQDPSPAKPKGVFS